MSKDERKNESTAVIFSKVALGVCTVVSFIVVASMVSYLFTKRSDIWKSSSIPKEIKSIELSSDAKSILNAETKKVIFTTEDASKYIKDSGYLYGPDTSQTANAKYKGDCFLSANLSNKKDRIVFSVGCFPYGQLVQAWIGTYLLPYKGYDNNLVVSSEIKFLIVGSGRNFVWSADDKAITYEEDLELSGTTKTRTIDSESGWGLIGDVALSDSNDWNVYTDSKHNFKFNYA